MSEDARRLRDLRTAVASLKRIDGKQLTTNQLVVELDQLWRSMLRARASFVYRAGGKHLASDFYSIYAQVHRPTEDAHLCTSCYSTYSAELACPFCLEQKDNQPLPEHTLLIQLDSQKTQPCPLQIPTVSASDASKIPELTAFTGTNASGLGAKKQKRVRKKKPTTRATKDFIAWVRKREACKHFPYSSDFITREASFRDLKTIAAAFSNEIEIMRALDRPGICAYILSNQPSAPIEVGPPPVGSMPKLPGKGK